MILMILQHTWIYTNIFAIISHKMFVTVKRNDHFSDDAQTSSSAVTKVRIADILW